MATTIDVTLYTDPGCPWGYSANPALRALEWRYGDQLSWALRMIGLAEDRAYYDDKGFTPTMMARFNAQMRSRYGMPFQAAAKSRMSATSPACRTIVAARIDAPGSEWETLRALQLAQFNSTVLLDDPDGIRAALSDAGLEPGLVDRIEDADVREAYEQDRAAARQAACTPGALQGKTAIVDGVERYTAPSLVLRHGDQCLEAAGFQPIEAYDVLVANLDPTLERRAPASSAAEVLERFTYGLVTQEVAAIMQQGNDPVDRAGVELELLELCGEGRARRVPIGDDARWYPASA